MAIRPSRCGRFLMQVSNKHGCGFYVENTLAAGFDLLEGRGIDGDGRLGRAAGRAGGLGAAATLAVAMKGDAPIFGMDSTVVTEKKVAAHEGAATLHALKRPLFGICIDGLALGGLDCEGRGRGRGDDRGRGRGRGRSPKESNIRDRSCLLLCSLLLKALLQNWHLYFLSGASEVFRVAGVDAAEVGMTATLAPGILWTIVAFCTSSGGGRKTDRLQRGLTAMGDNDNGTRKWCWNPPHRTIVEIA